MNIKTVTDSYVIPNLSSLNFHLKGKHVFSRLELVKGYNKVLQEDEVASAALHHFRMSSLCCPPIELAKDEEKLDLQIFAR